MQMTDSIVSPALRALLDTLRPANLNFAALHPGDVPARQPVHVVYGGGHLFRAVVTVTCEVQIVLAEAAIRRLRRPDLGFNPLELPE